MMPVSHQDEVGRVVSDVIDGLDEVSSEASRERGQ